MKTLLVTGGIGSGKSEACRVLERLGAGVYDSDSRAKALYDEDPQLREQVLRRFPAAGNDGKIDRKRLGSIVFADRQALGDLEKIVHPRVLADFLMFRERSRADAVVLESAIAARLPEFMEQVDEVLVIEMPLDARIERAAERDSTGRGEIEKRISAQPRNMETEHYTIINDSTLEALAEKVEEWYNKIKRI